MKRSAYVIFNPVAGTRDPEQDLVIIRSILEPEIELDIESTTPDVEVIQLAEEAVKRGVDTVIACGGDGTVSEVAGALVGSDIPLGIVPRGTANAFAAALGIPDTVEAACQTILAGKKRVVDAARCNGKPMLLLVGIGFEAETVERADRESKARLGVLAYILAGVQKLGELERFKAEIETEDKTVIVEAAAVTIANAAPPTSILAQGPAGILVDDGLLDVTVVAPTNLPGAIAASYHLLRTALEGRPAEREDIGYLRAKHLKVTATPPQKVVLDGEIIGTTPIEIECVPGGLTLFVPETLEDETPPSEKLEGLPGITIQSN